jgi:glycosyltransferase involved in cell wall biosynthesis
MTIDNHSMVSIVLPNYNHDSFLGLRIESILNQSHQEFELIILDDCSTDKSREKLEYWRQHPRVSHFVMNEENSGSTFMQWKRGLELAKGDWIWIAESDDFSDYYFLERMLEFASLNKECGLIYAQSSVVDTSGKILGSLKTYTDSIDSNLWSANFEMNGIELIRRALAVKNVIPNASAVIFRRRLMAHHFFDEKLLKMKMAGDWLMWIRIAFNTNVGFVSQPLNFFRKHDKTTRNHNSIEKRKRRLIEEKVVRDELRTLLPDLKQDVEIKALHEKWFDFHSLRFILDKRFWSFKVKGFSYLRFGWDFINYNKKYR